MPTGLRGSLEKLSEELLVKEIEAGLYEEQSLDFKRQSFGNSDAEKKDLLRDVVR